ncbi:hypothetical protein NC653_010449 [Populus alba x Populus x berolinensis]|uniref:Calmodulin binding protein-like N-terminal domain-containing protein n=1 Tax=Populus alba x Populus x berolinensis TaxID=444605 RepID=A0AAD6W571_9ROSI|nr:hypothetical protein NC653_010449 [Populus alba x Populus x berolinensis]
MERALGKLGPAKLTGQQCRSSPKLIELDLLVLECDFNDEDDDNWTREKFESRVIKEREGKRPVLTGDLQVTLKEGVGALGDMTFTDNSSWIKSREFRLGQKVASGYCEGIRILAANMQHLSGCCHAVMVMMMVYGFQFSVLSQNGNLNISFHFYATSLSLQDPLATNNLLALGPPPSPSLGSQGFGAPILNSYRRQRPSSQFSCGMTQARGSPVTRHFWEEEGCREASTTHELDDSYTT